MGHDGDGVDAFYNRVCSDCPLTLYAWKDSSNQEYAKQMVDACNRAIEDILTK